MRTVQYLLLTIVCAVGAVLMATALAARISTAFEHSAAMIENPREEAR